MTDQPLAVFEGGPRNGETAHNAIVRIPLMRPMDEDPGYASYRFDRVDHGQAVFKYEGESATEQAMAAMLVHPDLYDARNDNPSFDITLRHDATMKMIEQLAQRPVHVYNPRLVWNGPVGEARRRGGYLSNYLQNDWPDTSYVYIYVADLAPHQAAPPEGRQWKRFAHVRHDHDPYGWHTFTDCKTDAVVLRVRPVGTLQFGEVVEQGGLNRAWIPALLEALYLAELVATRPEPWLPIDWSTVIVPETPEWTGAVLEAMD